MTIKKEKPVGQDQTVHLFPTVHFYFARPIQVKEKEKNFPKADDICKVDRREVERDPFLRFLQLTESLEDSTNFPQAEE